MEIRSDPLLALLEHSPEGVRAGDCLLVEKLGAGGMGTVYLGRHLTLNVDVAVKVLSFHAAAADRTAVERFRKEATSTVRIDHPNVVRIFDVGEEHGVHYLVMEFVDGESADARLRREGPLPEHDALEISAAAGEALAAAHAKGILHRDVKPANIMIRFEDGRVKVADLGLAKALGGEGGETTGLTATGQMLGTPAYMSPEQATDASRTDARSDVYSLGATLYALLSGKAPFEATQLYALLRKVVNDKPRDLFELRPNVSARTAAAVSVLMAKDPARRPQAMAEALKLTRGCLDEAPSEGARGLARPGMAGRRTVPSPLRPGSGRPRAVVERRGERARTLEDVTPAELRRETRPTIAVARARLPALSRTAQLGIAAGIVAVAVLALGGYAYSRSAARRREEEAARRKAEKVASLVSAAERLREAGAFEEAGAKAREALSLDPTSERAAGLVGEIGRESKRAEAERARAAEYERWMGKALELKLAGKLEEAAEAYAKAAESAPPGTHDAVESAAACLHAHYKARAEEAAAEGNLGGALGLYAKALEKKEDAACRRALAGARRKLEAVRSEHEASVRRGKLALEGGKPEEALAFFEAARKALHRPELAGLIAQAKAAAERKVAGEAAAALARERRIKKDYDAALAAMNARDWEQAAILLEAVLKEEPEQETAAKLLGKARAEIKKKERHDRLVAEGRGHMNSGRWAEAKSAFGAAARIEGSPELDGLLREATRKHDEGLYAQAMTRAHRAMRSKSWYTAQREFQYALNYRPGDPEATDGLSRAKAAAEEDYRRSEEERRRRAKRREEEARRREEEEAKREKEEALRWKLEEEKRRRMEAEAEARAARERLGSRRRRRVSEADTIEERTGQEDAKFDLCAAVMGGSPGIYPGGGLGVRWSRWGLRLYYFGVSSDWHMNPQVRYYFTRKMFVQLVVLYMEDLPWYMTEHLFPGFGVGVESGYASRVSVGIEALFFFSTEEEGYDPAAVFLSAGLRF